MRNMWLKYSPNYIKYKYDSDGTITLKWAGVHVKTSQNDKYEGKTIANYTAFQCECVYFGTFHP